MKAKGKHAPIVWPEGRRFAFTVFDDPDSQSMQAGRAVYSFLEDLGLRTTKGVWTLEPRQRNSPGETCESREFLDWALELQQKGFEIGYHNGAPGTLTRAEVIRSLDRFREHFGADPCAMANHYNEDAMYWGGARLSGINRVVYSVVNRGVRNRFHGHVEGHNSFWGDVCRDRVRYCRNFVFRSLNTLGACPFMPYSDPDRPYVQRWYASSEGANRTNYLRQVREEEQDRLEDEGGACIMYTHFGHGFHENGRLDAGFQRLMKRLARKNGWFVPVSTLLDYLADQRGVRVLGRAERGSMERRWLAAKLVHRTS